MTYTVRVADNYHYTSFGEDPFIIGPGDYRFSAWDYAKERCSILCAPAA